MKIGDLVGFINESAPFQYQESYDNSGLITGNVNDEVKGVLCSLDCVEDVVQEAIEKNCNVILAHHPIVFGGLKSLTGANYVERTVIKAIKNDIAIIAAHTNMDNVHTGVNKKIAEKIGLEKLEILSPKNSILSKVVVFVPHDNVNDVREAMFRAGAGSIGEYDSCSYNLKGEGTFRAGEDADPHVGEIGTLHSEPETRVEVIVEKPKLGSVLTEMKNAHPYEEVAYDVYPLTKEHQEVGSGMVGFLPQPVEAMSFLKSLKTKLQTDLIRHTDIVSEKIEKVAICGGAGSFLLNDAIKAKADVFITGDYKYHQFFDADGKIIIADVGHFESEQFTAELFVELLQQNFSTFAIHLSKVNTNPISYL
ncbi:Nif3-like dinuclear metal center hexameric protein [Salibacter halophilus]|uniref:GTP cyclohydrolase 1 type 2 homolog n=1 Tax=Salibacter halophilus TaxID=1803916 RepID=A0A6N6MBF6_9FLAO|nr:Nif3-like dinuclear metal center hexameric protein [Salibacter halophilus]KAB1066196.1 Nif3-like dinuclear metal center hexameric protein [Salibacter halophilus]